MKKTGKTLDDRELHRSIRLHGGRVKSETVGKGERKIRTFEDGKHEVYRPGMVLTDPDMVEEAVKSKRVSLKSLREQGIVSGNW